MSEANYRDQDFKCCGECNHAEIEAEGQMIITCKKHQDLTLDYLGICDDYEEISA